jgi:hypothetical protein
LPRKEYGNANKTEKSPKMSAVVVAIDRKMCGGDVASKEA